TRASALTVELLARSLNVIAKPLKSTSSGSPVQDWGCVSSNWWSPDTAAALMYRVCPEKVVASSYASPSRRNQSKSVNESHRQLPRTVTSYQLPATTHCYKMP